MFYPNASALVNKHLIVKGLSNTLDLTIALFTDYGEKGGVNDFDDAFKILVEDKAAPHANLLALLAPAPAPRTLADVTVAELIALLNGFQSQEAIVESSTREILNRMFIELALADLAEERDAALGTPLWAKLGWHCYSFQPNELPDPGQLMNARNDAGELIGKEQYEVLFREACAQRGVPTDAIGDVSRMAIGKGDMAVWPTEESVQIDLGEHDHYRVADFVKGVTYATYTLPLNHPELKLQPGKDKAGDGIVGRVRPETIGYTGELKGEKTALQMRGFVFDVRNPQRVFAVYKGLLEVDPACPVDKQFFMPQAGYGHLDELHTGHSVVIETLCDIKDYKPRGRVSLQARYYEGHPSWKKRFLAAMTVRLSGLKDWERMVLADAGLMFLPVDAYISILRGAANQMVSYDQGVRRKVLPGLDLKPYEFRAPYELRSLYAVGKQYVIHRDPATPDGMAAWAGTCVGYVRCNAFEVPTNVSEYTRQFLESTTDEKGKVVWSTFGCWEQGGGDFDGDDALVTPHWKQGGLLLGFNDRSAEAQQALINAAGRGGRKGAGFNKLYPNGFVRWMNQRWAAIELGLLDFRARKLIDKHADKGRLMAAELKPLIQTAVDRQKRDLDYPRPLADLERLSGTFATKVFSFLRKPESELGSDKQSWKHSWDIVCLMAEHARKIVDREDASDLFMPEELHDGVRPVAEWFVTLYETICRVTGTTPKPGHYPASNRMPIGDITRYRQAELALRGGEEGLESLRLELGQLDAELVRLRRSTPGAARAAEELLLAWMQAKTPEDRARHALCFGDARSFVKFATDEQLRAVFNSAAVKVRASDLPGVVMAQSGTAWKLLPAERVFVNQQPQAVAGLHCEPGQVKLRVGRANDGRAYTELLLQGSPVARVAGQASPKTAGEFMRELASKVGQTIPTEDEFARLRSYQPLSGEAMQLATAPVSAVVAAEPAPVFEECPGDFIPSYEVIDAEPVWEEPVWDAIA